MPEKANFRLFWPFIAAKANVALPTKNTCPSFRSFCLFCINYAGDKDATHHFSPKATEHYPSEKDYLHVLVLEKIGQLKRSTTYASPPCSFSPAALTRPSWSETPAANNRPSQSPSLKSGAIKSDTAVTNIRVRIPSCSFTTQGRNPQKCALPFRRSGGRRRGYRWRGALRAI
jgi:hypothetical protein